MKIVVQHPMASDQAAPQLVEELVRRAEKARASPDEHDAKFIFTCREEAAVRTPDAYRKAAAQRLRL